MAVGFLKKFGGSGDGPARKLRPIAARVNALADEYGKLTDAGLQKKTVEFKERADRGESLDSLLPEAFANVREAATRTIKERHFDVQLMGGAALHSGSIAEMKTGEGKTLTSTLPVYLNALSGKGAHVVTVNEYLARRDTEWMGQIYQKLGVTVGNIYHDQPTEEKRAAYAADITYGTNNEYGFDYLRDNMVPTLDAVVQRHLNFAIVDEVDSILIDEARTPLIISGPAAESGDLYRKFAELVPKLQKETDYTVDEKRRSAILTDDGIKKIEGFLGIGNIYEAGGATMVHHLEQALQAHALFHRDKEYVVQEGQVVIVDEFTGRLMPGRRFSEGLHQAIEAKENVVVQQESKTMATITFQNYFRLYDKLSGMTGTAETEKEEFQQIYRLDVIPIPTHKQLVRSDMNDLIYKSEDAKFTAIAGSVKTRHEAGQPVLLGTIAVEKSEKLATYLKKAGIKHEVLNAKNNEREAEIIANAGQKGAVTVSTNMAGRGTDIKLGDGVEALGGLHVIGSERHESRRIDNQLRGRSGRQGDPGSTQFFVSLDDDLMRIFAGDRIRSIMERLKVPEDQPIEAKLITRSLETAQKKVEGHNFDIRKHVVQYDDVMNAHREVIYARRRKTLEKEDIKQDILDMFTAEVDLTLALHAGGEDSGTWEYDKIAENVAAIVSTDEKFAESIRSVKSRDELRQGLLDMIGRAYTSKEEEQGEANIRQLERAVMLRTVDTFWVNHLDAMEHLREGINLRGYGQRDPLIEYKREAFQLFEELLGAINTDITRTIFKVSLVTEQQEGPTELEQAAQNVDTTKAVGEKRARTKKAKIGRPEPGEIPLPPDPPAEAVNQAPQVQASPNVTVSGGSTVTVKTRDAHQAPPPAEKQDKIGRNDPCPCGSDLKYKKCGLVNAPEHQTPLTKN